MNLGGRRVPNAACEWAVSAAAERGTGRNRRWVRNVNTPVAPVESTGSWTFTRRTRARACTQRPRTWRNADDFRRSDSKLEIRDLGSGAHARRRRVRCRARGVQHHDARKDYVRPMARSSNGCRCWSSNTIHTMCSGWTRTSRRPC